MASKTPTQRGISLLLNRAGFERSVSSATRIRGWRSHSPGYVVTGHDDGSVSVRHEVMSFRPLPDDLPVIARRHGQYAEAIEAAGFAVERKSDHLIVTAKTED